MPRVSVIIPTYNRAGMLKQAIESVLAQTFRDYEIIVVDDGSTDDTRQRIQAIYDKRINYLYQTNQGWTIARNRGTASSHGKYLVFLDSDDLLLPNALESQAAALDNQPDVGLVAGGYQYVNEKSQVLREVRPWEYNPSINLETLLFHSLAPPSAVMVRRDWFTRVNGFDPKLEGAEDMDFWYRLILAGCRIDWERSVVCQYRIHDSNYTNNVQSHFAAFFAVLDALFARSDLPSGILARKQELYTRLRLDEVGRLFAAGELEDARALLKDALMLDPKLSKNHKRLTSAIVGWQKSLWVGEPALLLDTVFQNFPPEIASANFRRRVLSSCRKSTFYDAYDNQDDGVVRRLWVEIAKREPGWLLNRGGWSILLQSLGIKARRNIHLNRDKHVDAS